MLEHFNLRAISRLRFIRHLVVVLTLTLGVACSGGIKGELLGHWQEERKTERLEFFEDGKVSVSDRGMSATGTWSILDDGRLKMEVAILGTTKTMTGNIEDGILVFSDASRYIKVPN